MMIAELSHNNLSTKKYKNEYTLSFCLNKIVKLYTNEVSILTQAKDYPSFILYSESCVLIYEKERSCIITDMSSSINDFGVHALRK